MDSSGPTVIFLAMHKGGSSFIANGFAKALAATFPALDVVNVGNDIDDGIKTYEELAVPANGSAFVRVYPKEYDQMIEANPAGEPKFSTAKLVVLQRDPRDAAISRFYSSAYSHTPPSVDTERFEQHRAHLNDLGPKEGILRTAVATTIEFARLYEIIDSRPDALVTNYEQMITDPRGWIAQVGGYLGWTTEHQEAMFDKTRGFLEFPLVTRPDKHIRRMSPGNWLRFDQPALRNVFSLRVDEELMNRAGYPWPKVDD